MSKINIDKAGIENTFDALYAPKTSLWHFQFGLYGWTNVFVWAGAAYRGVEDALEEAAGWLVDNAPGHITSPEEMDDLYKEAAEDLGIPWPPEGHIDWDDPKVQAVTEAAETDMAYTEAGWLTSSEWYVNELYAGDELYAQVWEASIDHLAEEGDLDEEEVNEIAAKLGIEARWEAEELED